MNLFPWCFPVLNDIGPRNIIMRKFLKDTKIVQKKNQNELKSHSSALLISRYILRLQQRPRCPNRKMYLKIRRADEWLLT